MTTPWPVAMVGLGWVAEKVHLPYLVEAASTTVVGAFDVDEGRAIGLCERFRVPRLTSLAEILDSKAQVVVICTPPKTHKDIVQAALAAGKHVICEKPLATSGAEMRSIVAAAEAARRHVFCCMTNRFRDDIIAMRKEIHRGAIGEPRFARTTWLRANGIPGSMGALENGVLWDLGVHLIDAICWVTDWTEPTAARSFAFRVGNGEGRRASWYRDAVPASVINRVPDTAVLDVRFAGGQVARVDVSWSAQVPDDCTDLLISGTEGALRLATVFGWSESRARVQDPALAIADERGHSWTPLVRQEREQREYGAQLDYFFSQLASASVDATRAELPLDAVDILDRAAGQESP